MISKKKGGGGVEKIWAQFLTGREGEMTPRSVIRGRQSRMTLTFRYVEMPVDYSVNWRTEWDRQEERGKTKIELFGGETDILNSRWYAKYTLSCIYWQVFVFAVAGRSYAVIHFTVSLCVPMSDKQPIWVIFLKNVPIHAWIQYVCVCWRDVERAGGRGRTPRALWVSHNPPLARLSLGCLSPLTCPMACRLQTGTG